MEYFDARLSLDLWEVALEEQLGRKEVRGRLAGDYSVLRHVIGWKLTQETRVLKRSR